MADLVISPDNVIQTCEEICSALGDDTHFSTKSKIEKIRRFAEFAKKTQGMFSINQDDFVLIGRFLKLPQEKTNG